MYEASKVSHHTEYTLDAPAEVVAWLRASNIDAHYAIDENGKPSGLSRWDSHEADIKSLSKCVPDEVLTLSGKDEDGSLWRKYFKVGQMQITEAVITYPACELGDYDCDEKPSAEFVAWCRRQKEIASLRKQLEQLVTENRASLRKQLEQEDERGAE